MFRLPHLSKRWKLPRVFIALILLELAGTISALGLFAIAAPNLYRTKLWQAGADNGFNSSPLQILYAYANYRPIPKTPFVWSQALTDFNVVISVLSMFIFLLKTILFTLKIWYPLLATITNMVITGLWAASVYGQMGPDKSDPKHPSNIAWYITRSCEYARPLRAYNYCLQAKGAYATTVFMLFVFLMNTLLGIYSLIPSAEERMTSKLGLDDNQADDSPVSEHTSDKQWELKSVPKVAVKPVVPYTPRTLAFNTLDRQLPLRQPQYS